MLPYKIYRKVIDGAITWWREGDGCRLAGPNDASAGELFEYDSRCALCWLGYGHSEDYHKRALRNV